MVFPWRGVRVFVRPSRLAFLLADLIHLSVLFWHLSVFTPAKGLTLPAWGGRNTRAVLVSPCCCFRVLRMSGALHSLFIDVLNCPVRFTYVVGRI